MHSDRGAYRSTPLLQLAGMYCDAINEGALPNISNAFTAVIVAECSRALEEGARLYLEGVAAFAPTDTDAPLDVEGLHWHEEHARLHESALRRFKSVATDQPPLRRKPSSSLSVRPRGRRTRRCSGCAPRCSASDS